MVLGRKIKLAQALLTATQAKIEQWCQAIDMAISAKPDLQTYEERKKQLLPKLREAKEKGVTLRELARITGIPHQTIAKWLKPTKEQA